MKAKSKLIKLWTCPKYGHQFERRGQAHSCRPFPIEQHFEGKHHGKLLCEKFKRAVKKQVGSFKIESLDCCIHFTSTFTFVAVNIFKDKIRVDFSLNRKLKNRRIAELVQMSAHRYLHVIDIMKEDDTDEELMKWIQEAHDKKSEKAAAV